MPANLESLPPIEKFPRFRNRWNTNEEIAGILVNESRHQDWMSDEVPLRPNSGSLLLYNKKKVRYKRDGYCWKNRRGSRQIREDHMKLKVNGVECINGVYSHSALLPSFHRRCYFLLQNPDTVLVHYLNVPYSEDASLLARPTLPALGPPADLASADSCEDDCCRLWTQQQLLDQLQPMFAPTPCEESCYDPPQNKDQNNSTGVQKVSYSVSTMVYQLIQLQKLREHFRVNGAQKSATGSANKKGVPVVTSASTMVNSDTTDGDGEAVTSLTCTTSVGDVSAFTGQSLCHVIAREPGHGGGECSEVPDSSAAADASVSRVCVATLPPALSVSSTSSALSHVFVNVYRVSADGGRLSAASAVTGPQPQFEPVTTIPALTDLGSNPDSAIPESCHRVGGVLVDASPLLLGRAAEFGGCVGGPGCVSSGDIVANSDVDMSETEATNVMLRDALNVSLDDVRGFNGGSSLETACAVETPSPSRLPSNGTRQFTLLPLLPAAQPTNADCGRSQTITDGSGRSHAVSGGSGRSQAVSDGNGRSQTVGDGSVRSHAVSDRSGQSNAVSDGSGRSHAVSDGSGLNQTDTAVERRSLWAETMGSAELVSTYGRSLYGMNGWEEPAPGGSGQEVAVGGITEDVSLFDTLDDLDAFDFKCLTTEGDCVPCDAGAGSERGDGVSTVGSSDTAPAEDLLTITDICPDWSYAEGGAKLLIAGAWSESDSVYTAVFGDSAVECSLVQPGLLRCHSPPHEVGAVPLRVLLSGRAVSHPARFHFRCSPSQLSRSAPCLAPAELSPAFTHTSAVLTADCYDEVLVKMALVWRLRLLQRRLLCTDDIQLYDQQMLSALGSELIEERLIELCDSLAVCRWKQDIAGHPSSQMLPPDSPSLLHLSSALGLHRLVCALFRWRTESPSLCLEAEVDALRADRACGGATPLLLACARGHRETARLLHQWNPLALSISSAEGVSPVSAARQAGFFQLADELERLDTARQLARTVARQHERGSDLSLSVCDQWPPVSSVPAAPGSIVGDCPAPEPGSRQLFGSCSPGCGSCDSGLESLRCSSCSCCDQQLSTSAAASYQPQQQQQQHVLALAEHIIAAMPDRIKMSSSCHLPERSSSCSSCDAASLHSEPVSMEMGSVADVISNSDFSHRCMGATTPQSSIDSPCSSVSCQPSPHALTQSRDTSSSPPPSTADLGHYFQATRRDVTVDFSNLTLSDREQRELYEAAKVIQKAYRLYKGRKMAEERLREKEAANIIQNGFRRYKQYCYYTKMTRAAVVIQNRYRTYCEHKRFRHTASPRSSGCSGLEARSSGCSSGLEARACGCCCLGREKSRNQLCRLHSTTAIGHKRTYSQRHQHLAATKIQHFMRQSRNRLRRERELVVASAVCPPQARSPR